MRCARSSGSAASRRAARCSRGPGECVNLNSDIESTIAALRRGPAQRGWGGGLRAQLSFLALPPRCLYCGASGDAGPIDACGVCLASLPWSASGAQCGTLTALEYRDEVAADLRALKFLADRRAATVYGTLLAVRVALAYPVAQRPRLLVPVPLHPRRRAQRGFNQAALIARRIGIWLDLPVDESLLERRVATLPQASLPAAERRENVRDAFIVDDRQAQCWNSLIDCPIALVDDILTTGATLASAARALESAGFASVQRWAVARTMPTHTTSPTY